MNQKYKKMSVNVLLASVILANLLMTSCGPGQLFGPTLTPSPTLTPLPTLTLTPTVTPTPTQSAGPKVGHWEGEDPSVSFDILDDGNIHNFIMNIPFDLSGGKRTCPIEFEEIPVQENEVAFDFKSGENQSGEIWDQHILATFTTPTTLTGSWYIVVCEDDYLLVMDYLLKGFPTWSATWKE